MYLSHPGEVEKMKKKNNREWNPAGLASLYEGEARTEKKRQQNNVGLEN